MSIIHSFHPDSRPLITVSDVYARSDVRFRSFVVTFSRRVVEALLEDGTVELISADGIRSISNDYPVYRFVGTDVGLVKTTVGAPITSVLIEEVAHIYSCRRAVIFGTCGALDRTIAANRLIVPTHAYRDEGVSYHYLPPADYIEMRNWRSVCAVFDGLGIPYVTGRTWTTDAFYRETEEEIRARRSEGCIAVEMELAACQAVCDDAGMELYAFLYRADNLDAESWDKGQRDRHLPRDERLRILNAAFEIAAEAQEDAAGKRSGRADGKAVSACAR